MKKFLLVIGLSITLFAETGEVNYELEYHKLMVEYQKVVNVLDKCKCSSSDNKYVQKGEDTLKEAKKIVKFGIGKTAEFFEGRFEVLKKELEKSKSN